MKLTTFDFNEAPVRAMLDEQGEPWFVSADVGRALDLANIRENVAGIDVDDVSTTDIIDSLGRTQTVNIVSEAGLYELVLVSRKPEAKKFKRWITKEVLPAIRKTGRYETAGAPALSSAEEKTIDAMIAKIALIIDERHAGRIDNGTASVLANLCSQYLRAWDVKLRIRTPVALAAKGAEA